MEKKEIQNSLKLVLSDKRFEHTMGVAYTAASLAMNYGEDMEAAFLAGLLHDCAKGYSIDQQINLCDQYGIEVSKDMKKSPQLIHQTLGSVLAKEVYHIESKEILSAIAYHTTGKPEMTMLEKIIFIADYMEPNRVMIPGLSKVRKAAFHNIDECMQLILKNTIDYLQSKGQPMDVRTIETYHYYQAGE